MAYDRPAAVAYANLFAKRVCHDGWVAAKPRSVQFQAGRPLKEVRGLIADEDDCTHFISCCVGRVHRTVIVDGVPRLVRSGGIDLHSPMDHPHLNPGLYGEITTPRAFGQLQIRGGGRIVHPQFMDLKPEKGAAVEVTRAAIRKNLRTGDILAYAENKHLHKDGTGNYGHLALVVSVDPNLHGSDRVGIACHTIARFGEDFTDVHAFDFVTLLKFP
jgi:hypothetical protein